jgi:hypothetical protein
MMAAVRSAVGAVLRNLRLVAGKAIKADASSVVRGSLH